MTDDLVRQLRHDKDCLHTSLCDKAADRIEALEAALREIADSGVGGSLAQDRDIARRVLEGK